MTVSMPFLQILSSSCWEIANGAQDMKGDVLLKYKRDSLLWELVVAEVGNIIKEVNVPFLVSLGGIFDIFSSPTED